MDLKKLAPGQEICLWLVPAGSGLVRKVHIRVAHLLACVGVALALAGVFAFVTGNYARMSFAKFSAERVLNSVSHARDVLTARNSKLSSRLKALRSERSKVQEYKDKIKERINLLNAILEPSLKLDAPGHESGSEEGIGGAEIDCGGSVVGDRDCGVSTPAQAGSLNGFGWDNSGLFDLESKDGFMEFLDSYTDFIARVPVGKPGNGWISSEFGKRRSPFTGRWTRHTGIDFALPYRSEIRATADGTVKAVKWTRTYGLMVDIRHTGRVSTRFAHMSKALVKKGQKICRGQLIGLVGSSGRSTGPHLHYEVRVDGKPIDPLRLVELGEGDLVL